MDDAIISFLKERSYKSIILKSLFWTGKYPEFLIGRTLAFLGFFRGYFSLKEFINLLLPARFKTEDLRAKFSRFLNDEALIALSQFIDKDGSIVLYKNKFYPPNNNFYELAGLLFELIIFDQYHADDYLKDGSIVIDAGANIGAFSVFSSNLKKGLTIYAFEPAGKTFEYLKKNTASYKNIFCYNLGLGDHDTVKKLFTYKGSTGGSTFEDSGMLDGRHNRLNELLKEEARITTIDAFVAENNIQRIDFIKIDTEGYEAQILRGASDSIKKFKPVISVSAYHHVSDEGEIPKLVESICADYKFKLFSEYEKDFVFYVK